MPERRVLAIAHAYGNRRYRIAAALEAAVDMIEADLRYQNGTVWVRHEQRLPLLPLLYNLNLSGIHKEGPWAVSLGPLFLRWDAQPIRLEELIDTVGGRTGLLLDLKRDGYTPDQARAFVESVVARLSERASGGRLDFCGSWALLDLVRAAAPDLPVHYSLDRPAHWQELQGRLKGERRPGGITIRRSLLNEERAAALRALDIEFYAWDVRAAADAERAVALGAAGIIADDLALLRAFAGTATGPAGP